MTYSATGEPRGAGIESELLRREFRAISDAFATIPSNTYLLIDGGDATTTSTSYVLTFDFGSAA